MDPIYSQTVAVDEGHDGNPIKEEVCFSVRNRSHALARVAERLYFKTFMPNEAETLRQVMRLSEEALAQVAELLQSVTRMAAEVIGDSGILHTKLSVGEQIVVQVRQAKSWRKEWGHNPGPCGVVLAYGGSDYASDVPSHRFEIITVLGERNLRFHKEGDWLVSAEDGLKRPQMFPGRLCS